MAGDSASAHSFEWPGCLAGTGASLPAADCERPVAILIFDAGLRLIFVNGAGARGISMGEAGPILGCHWTAIWPDDAAGAVQAALTAALRGEPMAAPVRCRIGGSDPIRWELRVSPVRSDRGEVTQILCVAYDDAPGPAAAG